MPIELRTISKEELISKFKEIDAMGWIENKRGNNDGAPGNTLEDLLGIPENNLPIPNAAEWELKVQRSNTTSLLTLFHMEPSPRALKLVPNVLLPNYGWRHDKAGTTYPETERSFRATLNGATYTDRGFKIIVNYTEERIQVHFDHNHTDIKHQEWLNDVEKAVGFGDINPLPYWGFNDLYAKAGTKLPNCFYVLADTKKENGKTYFHYDKVYKLTKFNKDLFVQAINDGHVYIDFDARTGHNHGTKFRIHFTDIPKIYEDVEEII